ncbi:MAG: DUF839 domain-containing protein [Gammaproteobacteria bacterium]|jgi:hypothetical protein
MKLKQLMRCLGGNVSHRDLSTNLPFNLQRRRLLKQASITAGMAVSTPLLLSACGSIVLPEKIERLFRTRNSAMAALGDLQEPDENGVRLPKGFTSRVIARSNEKPVAGADYIWHWAPDGGATFATSGGGWIYVSNSEMSGGAGGVGALVFGVNGDLRDAYSILEGTSRNCAGGATPWGTWLSCEEVSDGHVWECDPLGLRKARRLDALGTFAHEAVAFDPLNNQLYLTEDEPDGRFYRFTPHNIDTLQRPDLTKGLLEVAQVLEGETNSVVWHPITDPSAVKEATRYQVNYSTPFNGGEGIVYFDGIIYMATKGDNRIWRYDTASKTFTVFYDAETHPDPILTGVDFMVATPTGEIFVAEDGGDLQIVAVSPLLDLTPVLQVDGQPNSEITGTAFNPRGDKMYFSSQRGKSGTSAGGITYEISGSFFAES